MKINGEEIKGFYVVGEESGTLNTKELKTLKECYEFIQEDKRIMKQMGAPYVDKYYIDVVTEKYIYEGYTLKKYKNKFMLK